MRTICILAALAVFATSSSALSPRRLLIGASLRPADRRQLAQHLRSCAHLTDSSAFRLALALAEGGTFVQTSSGESIYVVSSCCGAALLCSAPLCSAGCSSSVSPTACLCAFLCAPPLPFAEPTPKGRHLHQCGPRCTLHVRAAGQCLALGVEQGRCVLALTNQLHVCC